MIHPEGAWNLPSFSALCEALTLFKSKIFYYRQPFLDLTRIDTPSERSQFKLLVM